MNNGEIRVAVVGMGETGRGWAALTAAAGWHVSIYDTEGRAIDDAPTVIAERARNLIALRSADEVKVEAGLDRLTVGRSLLQACREADWVIASIREDVKAKQKLIEALESAAPQAKVVSSSSTALTANDLVARATRPQRCLIVHPLNPPELVPLVEVVPGPSTDQEVVATAKTWLQSLGKIPVLVKKPVLGNVVGRITAAVWREAIDLVLQGAIDAEDLDRAISLGPALGWVAAGPHLSYALSAQDGSIGAVFQHALKTSESIWSDLATWTSLDPDREHQLIHLIERAYRGKVGDIKSARDRRLAAVFWGLDRARHSGDHR